MNATSSLLLASSSLVLLLAPPGPSSASRTPTPVASRALARGGSWSQAATDYESPPMPTIARPVAGRTCSQVDPDYDGPEGVHLSTGEYVLQTVDLHSPGVGLDFQWVRTYRSRSGASSAHR